MLKKIWNFIKKILLDIFKKKVEKAIDGIDKKDSDEKELSRLLKDL